MDLLESVSSSGKAEEGRKVEVDHPHFPTLEPLSLLLPARIAFLPPYHSHTVSCISEVRLGQYIQSFPFPFTSSLETGSFINSQALQNLSPLS